MHVEWVKELLSTNNETVFECYKSNKKKLGKNQIFCVLLHEITFSFQEEIYAWMLFVDGLFVVNNLIRCIHDFLHHRIDL